MAKFIKTTPAETTHQFEFTNSEVSVLLTLANDFTDSDHAALILYPNSSSIIRMNKEHLKKLKAVLNCLSEAVPSDDVYDYYSYVEEVDTEAVSWNQLRLDINKT